MTFHALDAMGDMRGVVNLMTGILTHDVTGLVTLLARFCVHFRAEDRSCVRARDALEYVARAVHVSFELADESWLGMAVNAIGLRVDRPRVSGALPRRVSGLHDLAAFTKTGLFRVYRHSAQHYCAHEHHDSDNDNDGERLC